MYSPLTFPLTCSVVKVAECGSVTERGCGLPAKGYPSCDIDYHLFYHITHKEGT